MVDKILNSLKKYSDAGITIPVVLAIFPLLITALVTLRISYGDTIQAAYVIGEVGLVQIWVQGIGTFLSYLLPFIAAIAMLYSLKFGKQMLFSAFLLMVLVFFITNIFTLIFAIIFVYLIAPSIDKHAQNTSKKKTDKQSNVSSKDALNKHTKSIVAGSVTLFCLILMLIVLYYPTIPRSTLSLADGHSITGLVMKRDDSRVMIYSQELKSITMVYVSSIRSENICDPSSNQTAMKGLGWSLSRFLLEYRQLPTVPYKACSD